MWYGIMENAAPHGRLVHPVHRRARPERSSCRVTDAADPMKHLDHALFDPDHSICVCAAPRLILATART